MNKTYPVELYSSRRTGDEGCSITLHTTVEADSDDIKYLDENRGNQCFLLVTNITTGLEVPEIDIEKLKASMVENKVYDKNISPSERQRRKIWVLFCKEKDREPTKEEFEDYYMKWMDKVNDHLAEKITGFN